MQPDGPSDEQTPAAVPAGNSPAALAVRAVTRRFRIGLGLRTNVALHDLDLDVPAGEVLGLVGPNGSGKSTLLRILAGVDRTSSGDAQVFGEPAASGAARARVAYLPEDSPFPRELSARSALDLLGALSGLDRATARTRGDALLARVGLADYARAPLGGYSRGMKRRFGLAQAFLAAPDVVLLDEPTAGLDAPGFAVLDDLLTDARAAGTTVVLASHVPSDLVRHCDRLALLVNGRLAAAGTPGALLADDGVARLEVRGLQDDDLDELRAWIVARGGALEARPPGGAALIELYRRHGSANR